MKILLSLFSFILFSIILSAQTFLDKGVCKHFNKEKYQKLVENTKLFYPDVYKLMLKRKSPQRAKITADTLGTKRSFFVENDVTNAFDTVKAELRFKGNQTQIWVSVDEWANGHVNQNVVDDLSTALESSTPAGSKDPAKGIVDLINQYFGDFPDYDGDKITDFLVCDIHDGWVPKSPLGYTAGYFYSLDQTTQSFSNQRDILYLDSYPAIYNPSTNTTSTTGVLGTAAHELQHLVHYNYDKSETKFINEGMSTMAKWICGYPFRSPDYYFQNHNIPLLDWGVVSKNVLYDYSRAALFSMFITEQFGTDILKDLVQNTKVGEAAYNEEFQKRNPIMNLKQMFIDFCYANYIQDKSVAVNWGYDYAVPGKPIPKAKIEYPNTYSGVYSLNDYSVEYFEINSKNFSDTLKVTPEAVDGEAYRVNFNKGSDPNVEVITLFQEETIPDFKSSYESLVYVIFNFNGTVKDYAIEAKGTDNNTYWNQVLYSQGNAHQMWTFANGYFLASVGSYHNLLVSTDNGLSWGYYPTPAGVLDVWYDSNFDRYIIGTQDGVFSSDKTFQNWTEIGNLEESVSAVITDPAGNIFAGTYFNGIYKAQINSGNWAQFNNGITGGVVGFGGNDFAIDTLNNVFAFTSKVENSGDQKAEIYKLPLNGGSWNQVHSLTEAGSGVVFDGEDDIIYFTAGNSLYKYSNKGEDWIKHDLVFIIEATGLSVNPKNYNELFLTTGWGAYHSMDGGVSWTKRNNGFYYGDNELLYSVAQNKNGAVVVSSDWTFYTFNTSTTDLEDYDDIPIQFSLEHNYPNPFNPSTTIEYSVPVTNKISLVIYNILGEKITTLVNEVQNSGKHKIKFDASQLSSGVYFYQLRTNSFVDTKKMILIK